MTRPARIRQADLLRAIRAAEKLGKAGRQHVRDGMLRLKAEKTGTDLFVPFPDAFLAYMIHGGRDRLTFIAGADGKPMTKESFGNSFREWCAAAGVDKSAHGLRKASATLDAESNATELELQAKFGWITNTQSAVYTRAANREALARSLARKSNAYSLSDNQLREKGKKTK